MDDADYSNSNDSSDSSSDESDQDDPLLFLLHTVQEEYLSDICPLTDSEKESIVTSDAIPREFGKATSSLFSEFSYLFAQDFSEIPGVASAPYSLNLVSADVKPVTSHLQR